MKKWILFFMALVAIQTYAADYTYKYLVFTASNGTQTHLATDGLTLNIDGNGGLVAKNGEGTTTLTLASLAKMEFSADGTTTAIEQVESIDSESRVEVYNLSGIYKGSYSSIREMKSSLGKGIFLIQQNGKKTKMIIK